MDIFNLSKLTVFFLSGVWDFFDLWCWGYFWSEFVDCVTVLYLIVNEINLVMKVGLNLAWMFKKKCTHKAHCM